VNQLEQVRGYRGGYLIGFIIISAVALRTVLFYQGLSNLILVISLLASYAFLYSLEPWFSNHFGWGKYFYFPMQTCAVIALTNLRPFTDVSSLLYVPLCLQVFRSFSRQAVVIWMLIFTTLLTYTLLIGLGWLVGLALALLFLAVCTFLVSFDILYIRKQADQAESQRLLHDLQSAYRKLEEYAEQVEELAAARERNRLARELHDSVSQAIFGVTLTSQSARLLLDREPARVPKQIEHLQEMTSSVLSQLRSIISELRPE
jgi:signal transduction histidine kinase